MWSTEDRAHSRVALAQGILKAKGARRLADSTRTTGCPAEFKPTDIGDDEMPLNMFPRAGHRLIGTFATAALLMLPPRAVATPCCARSCSRLDAIRLEANPEVRDEDRRHSPVDGCWAPKSAARCVAP